MQIQRLYEQFLYGNMTPFRIQNSGQNEYQDPENIRRYRRGVYKLVHQKYNHLLKLNKIPLLSDHFAYYLFTADVLLGIASIQILFNTKINKCLGFSFLAYQLFSQYENQLSKSYQTFLLQNFENFTRQEQLALQTGDARFFYESFGDLKQDKKIYQCKVL